jgi:predicted DNA-binding transcriptional regulator AlpA
MARGIPLCDLPDWPRLLSREEAATYVGVSATLFDQEVSSGMWPQPIRRGAAGGRVTWDRVAIDKALDTMAVSMAQSGAGPTLGELNWGS